MDKKYLPLRNTKPFKWILSIILFFIINVTGLTIISTNYIETLNKINTTATISEIEKLIKPISSSLEKNKIKYVYLYLPFGNWKLIMKQTPKLTKKFCLEFFVIFSISLISFTIPYWKKRKLTSHGSAEWGTYDDLKKNPKQNSDISFLGEDGIVIGYIKTVFGKLKLLYDSSNVHMALVLPTRGGKGVGFIIPSLVAGLKRSSTFVTDIKKENYEKTSWYRAKVLKHRILKFEPLSELSSRYNFLSEIRYGTSHEIEDCRLVGNNIVGEDNSNDKFWGDSARDIISTLVAYVHYKELSERKEENPDISDIKVSLNDVISMITNSEKSLYELFANYLGKLMDEEDEGEEKEEEFEKPQDFLLKERTVEKLRKIYMDEESQRILDRKLHPFIAKQFGYFFQNTSENTFKSISSTAKTKLQVFELPTVVKNISKSDFKISDLVNGDKPVDLYFVIKPKDLDLLAPLVRLMTVQISNLLMETLNGKKYKITFVLDEFASFGKMPSIITNLGYYAGYNIKVMAIFQGLDQVNAIYGKENKVMSGCQIQIFGRPNDDIAPDYITKTLDKETIKQRSKNIGLKGGGSISEGGKTLLSVGEIRQLPDNKVVTLTGFKKPLLLDKLYYYKYPELLERTQHQPVFYKDGKIIFEPTEDGEYKYLFSMKEEDFYNDEKYEKNLKKIREKYGTKKLG